MKKLRIAAALAAAALAATACGGGSGDGAQTLTIWHYEDPEGGIGKAWTEAIAEFRKTHPDVTVEFEEKSFEQMQKTAPMVLNSDGAPDVMEYNKGNATTGLLARQGLLTDLTGEVTKRGWDKLLAPSLQTTAKYDAKGVMGGDKWYGVPNYAEYVMVYYNKDLFEKHDVKVPTTLEEFTAGLDTFTKAGVTPIAMAGNEYPGQHLFYEFVLNRAQRSWVDDYQRYTGKVDFNGPELAGAAQTFADWVSKGYLAKDSAGIKAEAMGTAWMAGKYPVVISGTWWYERFTSEVKNFAWGTFLFPGNRLHPGSAGNHWVVPTRSDSKDLAQEFIALTMSRRIQNRIANEGAVAVAADPGAVTNPKYKDLATTYQRLVAQDGLAFYPDWPVPGYYDTLLAGTQTLLNRSKSPQQFLGDMRKPYEDNLADIGG
ncbi:ABC transporter substrate-binding protein [Thermomonospora umbrina]|uniref:Raffinose/stachyose/melibiose transport system substrate-binding protein n=1 Tax=Thermomonospora umbrina TaxID=111806 RepID=A0A3D9SH18_9ACTN|nr:extracellular solute-binding protein [Thermomonospora umbrina]REE95208.1 raffinose/stachyose/melibiose transport system substrate-binding protein [Thermomonospora umbrina]